MLNLRHGWFCGGLTALTITALLASDGSAQPPRVQTQKSTAKSTTKKKDLKNPGATPPKAAPVAPVLPATSASTVAPTIPGLVRFTYSPPGSFALYQVQGSPFYPSTTRYPANLPSPYQNYFNTNAVQLPVYPNPYWTSYNPFPYYPQNSQLPYYNSLYTNNSLNPYGNVNPGLTTYNSLFNVSPYSNPYGLDPALASFPPLLNQQQPYFGGGLLNGGLLYRGPGY